MGPLEISVFGGLKVNVAGRSVSRFRSRATALVLAYLALNPERQVGREELIDVVWPESDSAKGRHNLRTALLSLRRQFEADLDGRELILADPQSVRLNESVYSCDGLR